LIEVEEQAKQSADLCFYVIDNQTRAVASMVEAAYLAGLCISVHFYFKRLLSAGSSIWLPTHIGHD
jgi:hypothetical protein